MAGYSAEAAWFHLAFPDILGLRRRCMRHGWNSNQQQMCIAFWMVMRVVFITGHRHGLIVSSEWLLRTQLFRSASLRPFRKRSRTYTKNNASGCLCQGRTQHHHSPCSVVSNCSDDLDRTSECPCTTAWRRNVFVLFREVSEVRFVTHSSLFTSLSFLRLVIETTPDAERQETKKVTNE